MTKEYEVTYLIPQWIKIKAEDIDNAITQTYDHVGDWVEIVDVTEITR